MKLERKTVKAISVGLLSVVIVTALFFFIKNRQLTGELSKGFPLLLPGAYVGAVEFAANGQRQNGSLYVERLREGNTLLFVIFLKDFQPQTIFSQKLPQTAAGQSERYRPVTLLWKDQKMILSGKEESGFFKGIVKIDGDNVGNWSVRRMTPEETVSTSLGGEEEKVLLWLKAKERLRKNTIDKTLLNDELVETTKKVDTLSEALGDKQLLQSRSVQRRKELETEYSQLKSEREKSSSEMESLVNSLDLLTRIKKRGQAVSLERKILQRENRWYHVHWQGEDDSEVLTEEESGIDMAKLESAVRKARETKSFLREKEDEIQKIQELTEELNNPGSPSEETPETPEAVPTEKPAEEKNKLWDRLFG